MSRSIRESGTSPRRSRGEPPQPPLAPAKAPPRPVRTRPDANPTRIMLGLVGLASAAAFTTALLPSVVPQPVDATDTTGAAVAEPQPPVQHVTRYVTLAPGQTAPPQSTVIAGPQPTPKVTVKVVTRTRQSGLP